jgi:hypothetical protein
MVLYKSTLLSSDMVDFCPMIQYTSFAFKRIFYGNMLFPRKPGIQTEPKIFYS